MTPTEKRKFIRLDSLHLLDYIIVDKSGNECGYSMGRTLDVSINGIKMETVLQISLDMQLIITLGLEDNLIDVIGKPIHTATSDNRFVSGIEFNKVNGADRAILRRYVDEFQARKEMLLQKDDFPPVQAQAM